MLPCWGGLFFGNGCLLIAWVNSVVLKVSFCFMS